MILTDSDILKKISDKEIFISPFDKSLLRPSSYCLTLGVNIYSLDGGQEVIDLLDGDSYPKLSVLPIVHESYVLSPNEFVLAETEESIGLSENITGHLSNISGLARVGVSIALSTHIASGFGRVKPKKLALEIKNFSNYSVKLTRGIRICHLVLAQNFSKSDKGYDEMFPDKYRRGVGSEYYKK